MRSQEIKVDEAAQAEAAVQQTDKGTFWSRVKAMFVDIWNTIFHHGSKTEE
jgi:hypothetical protein